MWQRCSLPDSRYYRSGRSRIRNAPPSISPHTFRPGCHAPPPLTSWRLLSGRECGLLLLGQHWWTHCLGIDRVDSTHWSGDHSGCIFGCGGQSGWSSRLRTAGPSGTQCVKTHRCRWIQPRKLQLIQDTWHLIRSYGCVGGRGNDQRKRSGCSWPLIRLD